MEKAQAQHSETFLQQIIAHPAVAETYISTLQNCLSMSRDVLHELLLGKTTMEGLTIDHVRGLIILADQLLKESQE